CRRHFSFFFSSRRRHTRFSRDWSSDVCSSDLEYLISRQPDVYIATGGPQLSGKGLAVGPGIDAQQAQASLRQILGRTGIAQLNEIGRASCRDRGWGAVVAGALTPKQERREERV